MAYYSEVALGESEFPGVSGSHFRDFTVGNIRFFELVASLIIEIPKCSPPLSPIPTSHPPNEIITIPVTKKRTIFTTDRPTNKRQSTEESPHGAVPENVPQGCQSPTTTTTGTNPMSSKGNRKQPPLKSQGKAQETQASMRIGENHVNRRTQGVKPGSINPQESRGTNRQMEGLQVPNRAQLNGNYPPYRHQQQRKMQYAHKFRQPPSQELHPNSGHRHRNKTVGPCKTGVETTKGQWPNGRSWGSQGYPEWSKRAAQKPVRSRLTWQRSRPRRDDDWRKQGPPPRFTQKFQGGHWNWRPQWRHSRGMPRRDRTAGTESSYYYPRWTRVESRQHLGNHLY